MPHKKNPDVFELIRAKCNKIQALPNEIDHIWINLNSGYFRDMQVIKESFLPVFVEIRNCIGMLSYAVAGIVPTADILSDSKYQYVFSVEAVNKLVQQGIPFREAYKQVSRQISEGSFQPDRSVNHTHEGSIGNLCNNEITQKMESTLKLFRFENKDKAYHNLLMFEK